MMKNKLIFSIVFCFLSLYSSLYARQTHISLNQDKIYFLPKQGNEVKKQIVDLIEHSKKSIIVSMYNFSYKKFAKALVKASKQGVKIKVYLDKSKVKKDDEIYKYLRKNDIKVYIAKEKLHTKIAIFDDDILMMGSSNWTKESFKQNNEVILFIKNKNLIEQTKSFLDSL